MELKELVERYQTAINQVYRRVNGILKDKMHSDITTDQFSTLHFIFKHSKCTSTDIAHEFGVGKSAVTAQINRLDEKGLIVRERDENDRRVVYLSVTDKGTDFVNYTEKAIFEILGSYLKSFEKEEIYTFIHSLEKLAKIMNEDLGE
ncbi:MarR family winged helix-turn-helix transcriptional regulator [Paucisalibacillus globulus]|uniref:MarR family winged helix-turn-helix transcriptional regulator n=1 Tax=Paucisalibacillus globulus TaxID=351095 RepID=UPI000416B535|nr:MarR family transcriptional regulator [Paucisalibacillus globulus]